MSESTTKGSYLVSALALVAEREGEEKAKAIARDIGLDEEIKDFRDYPLKLMSQLVFVARDRYWPDEADDEVAERFGAHAFGTFAQSLIGRVGLNLTLTGDPKHVAESVISMHSASSKAGACVLVSCDETSFTIKYTGPINPHWQLGLMRVGFEQGAGGQVELTKMRRFDVGDDYAIESDFDLKITLAKT